MDEMNPDTIKTIWMSSGFILALALLIITYTVFIEDPFNSYLRNFCNEKNQTNNAICYSNYTIQELVSYVDMIKSRA